LTKIGYKEEIDYWNPEPEGATKDDPNSREASNE